MKRRVSEAGIYLALAALLITAVYLIHPINKTAMVRQTEGTDFSQPYLGRTKMIQTGQTLRQYFTAPQSGYISAIGIFTPQPNKGARGSLTFKLAKINGKKETMIYTSKSNIANLANNEGLSTWRFQPVKARKGDRFAVCLTPKGQPGFLAFIANKDAYKAGAMTVNNKGFGVDIAFQVFYGLTWPEFWRHLSGDAPNLLGPAALLSALIIFWLILAAWLRQLWQIRIMLEKETEKSRGPS